MESAVADPPVVQQQRASSHAVRMDGDRVTVLGVTLLSGFDPDIHDGNEVMARFGPPVIRAIHDGTLALMERGLYPRIVVGHMNAEHGLSVWDDRSSVGRVTSIRLERRGRALAIVGDMEYSAQDFDSLVASNRYPRRSVETFVKPDRIGAVALLGGDTPRSPVEDTDFAEDGSVAVEQDETTYFSEVGIGGGAPVPPQYMKKENNMNDEMKEQFKAICREVFAEMIAEREKTLAEPKPEDKDDGEQMSESVRSALAERDARIATLEQERRVNFADRKMAEMSARGISVPAARSSEIREWLAAVGPEKGESVAALVADLCAGASPTRRIDMSAAAPAGARRNLSRDEAIALASKHVNDPKGYIAALEAAKSA